MTATAKRLLARDPSLISEADLSGLVVELARLGGWTRRYHTLRSKGSASGFPDWVFVKGPRLLFVELKSEKGKVSDAQREWLIALQGFAKAVEEASVCPDCNSATGYPGASVEVCVWRPSDFETFAEILTGKKPVASKSDDVARKEVA